MLKADEVIAGMQELGQGYPLLFWENYKKKLNLAMEEKKRNLVQLTKGYKRMIWSYMIFSPCLPVLKTCTPHALFVPDLRHALIVASPEACHPHSPPPTFRSEQTNYASLVVNLIPLTVMTFFYLVYYSRYHKNLSKTNCHV